MRLSSYFIDIKHRECRIQAYDVKNTLIDVIALDRVDIFLDGLEINSDTRPYINQDSRTMVPLRLIAEKLGADVFWNNIQRSVTIDDNQNNIQMTINTKVVMMNGKNIKMDTSPVIENSRVMVPIRFITEYLGASVEWNANQKTININSNTN